MESNKYQISDEELLKLVDNTPDSIGYDSIDRFIQEFDLKKGTTPISKTVLYTLYKNTTKTPLDRNQFKFRISLILPTDKSVYYVTEEFFEKAVSVYNKLYKTAIIKPKHKRKTNPFAYKQIEAIIGYYNIQKGKDWIEDFVLFHFYDKWLYNEKPRVKPLKKRTFILQLKEYLDFKQDNKGIVWFGLDFSKLASISPEQVNNIRAGRKWRKNAKKENKKKSR
jgi:hypothetical protein